MGKRDYRLYNIASHNQKHCTARTLKGAKESQNKSHNRRDR